MNQLSRRTISLFPILVCTALCGCVTATVQQVREAETSLTANDSVVVLGRRNRPSSAETEIDFISCVSKKVSGGDIRVIPEQEFVDALFPWFEPRTAPLHNSDLPELIGQPLLAERIREIGLKYLIWIEGSTQRTNSAGSMSCSITPGGAGCFGFLSWENDSSYEAAIWDARSGRTAGRVSSDAAGTSYMPAIVIPIPIIARVKNGACTSLAEQLLSFVKNESQ